MSLRVSPPSSLSPREVEERRLFVRRAALPLPPPPAFADVLARAHEKPAAGRTRRVGLFTALALAAAVVVGFVATGDDEVRREAIVAEPAVREVAAAPPLPVAVPAPAPTEPPVCMGSPTGCAAPTDDSADPTCTRCEPCTDP